jgi:hypothetical protein
MIHIYKLIDPRNDNIRYIGKTVNPYRRIHSHISKAKLMTNKTHSGNWIRSLLFEGLKPRMEIIETIDNTLEWSEREIYWIKFYRELGVDLTNFKDGGINGSGNASYGRLGKKNSPEHIRKTSEGRRGKSCKRCPEANKRRADGIRRYWRNNKRKVYQYDLNGNFLKEWESSKEAGTILGVNYSCINKVAKYERGSAYNFQWRFYKNDKIITYEKIVWNKSRKHSPEHIEKMRKARKGIPWSESRREAEKIRKENKKYYE